MLMLLLLLLNVAGGGVTKNLSPELPIKQMQT